MKWKYDILKAFSKKRKKKHRVETLLVLSLIVQELLTTELISYLQMLLSFFETS